MSANKCFESPKKTREGRLDYWTAAAAKMAGVFTPFDFATFQDEGYKGLYSGLGIRDIHDRKGLKKNERLPDQMGSTELAANLFRLTQTEEKLRKDNSQSRIKANKTYRDIGKKVRKAISDIGGTMPENLPTEQTKKKTRSSLKKRIGAG